MHNGGNREKRYKLNKGIIMNNFKKNIYRISEEVIIPPSANIFGFGSTGSTNATTACTLNDDSVDLYSPDAVLGIGSILYTDLALTIPFNGLGWSWHTGGLPGLTYVISNVGVIIGSSVC